MSVAAAHALIRDYELEQSRALGREHRRGRGVYYTPPEIAEQVVELALRHGGVPGRAVDPCAGAGAFLLAASRAGLGDLHGFDLDAGALRVARRALRLCGAEARLRQADALRVRVRAPFDLVLSNPPYGHVDDAGERAFLAQRLPALRGGEIDRYAAFLLRSLELLRPGGVAALLVPDTWMSNARGGALRAALLDAAEVAALVDLGKPFAAARDTRVQAAVLVKRPAPARATFVGRGREALAPVEREDLVRAAPRGFVVYRSAAERDLLAQMERASQPLGEVCVVGYGLRTGDNARHVARRAPEAGEVGLVGGEDVVPYALRWKPKTLVDAAALQPLVARQLGTPRIAVQRIRTNAQAPWARWLEAAPVPAERVCLDSLSTLACASDELRWALLALVSSVALNRVHRLRTTDVNVKPSSLRELPAPRALVSAPATLARLARERAAGADVDRRIDAEVYAAYGLSPALVEACERGFWGERFSAEFPRLDDPARGRMSDPSARLRRMEGTAC